MEPGGGKSTPLSPDPRSKQDFVFFAFLRIFTFFIFLAETFSWARGAGGHPLGHPKGHGVHTT